MTDANVRLAASACNQHGESSGAVVLRVKRHVTEEPLPTLALHAKKLRLQTGGNGAAVFRLAGTLGDDEDSVALQRAVARAMEAEGSMEGKAELPGSAAPKGRQRKRYRILHRADLSGPVQRAQKRKRQSAGEAGKDAADGAAAGTEDGDAKRSKGVQVFDVEFDSSREARCERALDDYERQLESITMNDKQLVCSDAGDRSPSSDSNFVYDLYLSNASPGDFVMTSDLGTAGSVEEDGMDEGGWAFLLDGYEENYNFPHEYRQAPHAFEDDDSDPESESNWRNEYPDAIDYEDHESCSEDNFELWMGRREVGLTAKDSDDELGGYADDADLERGLREMELSRGAANSDLESEEEASGGPHSMHEMRRMYTELLRERADMT